MRSVDEMVRLIIDTAQNDERIRAVLLNGSRANPNAPADFFQDFDIVYMVTDLASFLANPDWINCFGERMILQLPDLMSEPAPDPEPGFTYLMQFMDGNRIDLNLCPVEHAEWRTKDSLTRVLLDKDGMLPPIAPPSEADYLPKPPSQKSYDDCCNEFWWVCPYAAKGLWRNEILYARHMMDAYIRPKLMEMLTWHIGIRTDFAINPGKLGKYFQRYLEPEDWGLLMETYTDAQPEKMWQALFSLGELFRKIAKQVAMHYGYAYPFRDDERVSNHLRHVHTLPRDAREMY